MIDVIVTGANGFIGRELIRRLEKEGLLALAVNRQFGDVAESETWASLPKARIVIHLAGRSYVPDSWPESADYIRANVVGTEQCLSYCRRHGARMVFVSAYVYGIPEELPIAEDHPIHPNNPYALSKRMAEELCQFSAEFQGVNAVILRLFNVFGPGQRAEFLIPTIIAQVKAGGEIRVRDLMPRRDYIYLEDVLDALMLASKVDSGSHILNIGSGKSYSVKEIIDTVQYAAGTQLPVVAEAVTRVQEIPDVVANIDKAKSILGWKPSYQFLDGIQEMIKFDPPLVKQGPMFNNFKNESEN